MALSDHRTTRPMLAVATISSMCLGLAACGSSGSPSVSTPPATTSTSTAAPSTTTSSPTTSSASETGGSTTAAADFEVGQCYDDTANWTPAPCTQQHKLEITAIVKTTQYAGDAVKRGVLRTWTCNNVVAGYVGSPSAGFSRILGQPVPTAVDTGAGTHIVCAAAVAKADDSGYEEIGYRLKNRIKDKGYVDYRICTSDRPSKSDSPKIVPCTDPHKAETIGGYVIGRPDSRYPGSKAVDKSALAKCVPLARTYLGTTRGDVIAAANSTGRSGWQQGTTMTACFVEATNGTFVKPLRGMKNQPLSKFR